MLIPNKLTTINESVFSKFIPVIKTLENRDMSALELYYTVKSASTDIDDYMVALDCLYALGKIEYNDDERTIYYVGNAG